MTLDTLYKRNTNPRLFEEEQNGLNCGSFALNVTSWYCPYIDDDDEIDADNDYLWSYTGYERFRWIEDLVADGWDREDIMLDVLDRDFEFILMTCPWLEPITKEEIKPNDRVIAYRISMLMPEERNEFDACEAMDFHFRVLINGEWWEKNGRSTVHFVGTEVDEEPWVVTEWLIYDGEVRYARFKEV